MKHKKSFFKGALFGALVVLSGISAVSCSLGKAGNAAEAGGADSDKMELLNALIDEYYTGEVDEEKLETGIYKGYIEGLEDPYSAYYDQDETAKMTEMTTGEFGGIGVVVTQDKETQTIRVMQVYEDSPADNAGIKEGDIFYKIEGEDITGQDINAVVKKIKGEIGTTVQLTMLRGDNREEKEFAVKRDTIVEQTVESKMTEEGIGYIRITEFASVTYDQYKEAIDSLEEQGMERLIVDLRNNPGGNLKTVCQILDLMLPEGLIVYTEDKNGEKEEYTSDAEHVFEKPLVVLMNGNSASASEIFGGAIQDYGTGQIVGTQSYGKGLVQQIFDLQDGTSVKLTIAEYFTPKGRNINGTGIAPDVEIEYVYDENNPDRDNQLEKAIETVKNI